VGVRDYLFSGRGRGKVTKRGEGKQNKIK